MRATIAALAALLLVGVSAPSAHAADPVVDAYDYQQDVKIYPRPGPGDFQRKTIDLYRLTVTQLTGKVRFTVRLKKVLPESYKFDQMVFIDLTPAPSSDQTWSAQYGFSPQQLTLGYATLFLDESGESYKVCDPLVTVANAAKRKAYIDVPNKCVPTAAAKIKLNSYLGTFRSDAPTYSRDFMKVNGAHDLR
jgi:hypothetical protein